MRRTRATTERRNPASAGLDTKSTREILDIINREDAHVAAVVAHEIPSAARAVDRILRKLREGGRLFYVGAGTSGRLGVLDASEIPPTFGVPPRRVQGIIAGGRRALVRAVEGAEDNSARGRRDLAARRLSKKDVVVGLTASGTTPYVLGALRFAKRRGAATIAVTCNRRAPVARAAEIAITLDVGPEVVAGSTRMKAGTAQKLVLNMLSTAVMVRLGYVYDNWMINVARTNRKLRRRATRILEEAAGLEPAAAARTMRAARGDLRVALVIARTGASPGEARKRLGRSGGNLRLALARTSES